MELRDYVRIVLGRKRIALVAMLLGAGLALAASLAMSPVYEAEAKILILEQDSGSALFGSLVPELSSQPERGLMTQVELMQLRPLAEKTVRDLDLQMPPDDLLDDVSVTAVPQTNVVTIVAKADDPVLAADIANTLGLHFVEWSRATKRESISAAADEVEMRLAQAEDEIIALAGRAGEEESRAEIEAQLSLLANAYVTLTEKLEQLRINSGLEEGSGSVVSPAIPPAEASGPKVVQNTALGGLTGLLLGFGGIFLVEYLDRTIRDREEFEQIWGVPVLGAIPSDSAAVEGSRDLVIGARPGSSVAEGYRALRNSLDFVNFEKSLKTILVTSAMPNEGKSTVAANLAAGLGQAGRRVVLLSCDFRRPATEEFFDVNDVVGLSDVLTGAHSMKAALQRPGDEQVLVMTSGRMPPNPSELLGSEKMRDLLENLKEWADWIILDSPPVLPVADAAAVSRWADGVVIVAKAGSSTKDEAQRASELLVRAGASISGVVVWDVDVSPGREGYGYYAGDYAYVQRGRGQAGAQASQSATGSVGTLRDISAGDRRRRVVTSLVAFSLVVLLALTVVYLIDSFLGLGLYDFLPALSVISFSLPVV